VHGSRITAVVDGETLFDLEDPSPIDGGALALLVEEGRVECDGVGVGHWSSLPAISRQRPARRALCHAPMADSN